MFRSATRTALRAASRPVANAQLGLPARRFASTSPSSTSRAAKPSTWRSTLVRWGLAGALVYYYNTSPAFAEEPQFSVADKMGISKEPSEPPEKRTIQAILDERKHKSFPESEPLQTKPASPEGDASSDPSSGATPGEPSEDSELLTPGELHDEASSQGAFNEETGEINWDCPCLGGMAHGPCGEEFKAAFSCFVYSKEEPKGMDCIEKFKGMQDCFRLHPEIYGSELEEEVVEAEINKERTEEKLAQASNPEAPEQMSQIPDEPPSAPMESVKEVSSEKKESS